MTNTTMRAARIHDFGGPEVIRLEDVPIPEPGPGQVRLRVESAALNHLDLWVRRGLPIEIAMPHVGGSDLAGVVDAVGDGVAGGAELEGHDPFAAAPGARVVVDPSLGYGGPTPLRLIGEHVDGGFAQFAIVPAGNLVALPSAIDFDTAAAASLAGVTAWRGLFTRGRVQPGEVVLVTGASGGVSTMAIQFAKGCGARVIALTSTPWVEQVSALGADLVLDRMQGDWVAQAREWLAAPPASDGHALPASARRRGVDVILDSVGGALWDDMARLLAPGGRLVSYGATSGAKVEIDLRHHFWKQTEFLGSTMGTPEEYRSAISAVIEGQARPPIHSRMTLAQLPEAHRLLEAGEVFGKIIIHPWG